MPLFHFLILYFHVQIHGKSILLSLLSFLFAAQLKKLPVICQFPYSVEEGIHSSLTIREWDVMIQKLQITYYTPLFSCHYK